MQLTIEDKIITDLPDFLAGVLIVRGIDNHGEDEEIQKELFESLRRAVAALKDFSRHQTGSAAHFTPSIQNIIQNCNPLKSSNKLSDLCRMFSLTILLPISAKDTDKIGKNLCIRLHKPDETAALVMTGGKQVHSPTLGRQINSICTILTAKEEADARVSPNTKNACIVIEALPPTSKEELNAALGELDGLIHRYLGGDSLRVVLNEDRPKIKMSPSLLDSYL